MNFKCSVCRDLFTPASSIYATRCGHIFHRFCIRKWLKRSYTCPECRSTSTRRSIFKLHLTVDESIETVNSENERLRSKVKTLENELQILETKRNFMELTLKLPIQKLEIQFRNPENDQSIINENREQINSAPGAKLKRSRNEAPPSTKFLKLTQNLSPIDLTSKSE